MIIVDFKNCRSEDIRKYYLEKEREDELVYDVRTRISYLFRPLGDGYDILVDVLDASISFPQNDNNHLEYINDMNVNELTLSLTFCGKCYRYVVNVMFLDLSSDDFRKSVSEIRERLTEYGLKKSRFSPDWVGQNTSRLARVLLVIYTKGNGCSSIAKGIRTELGFDYWDTSRIYPYIRKILATEKGYVYETARINNRLNFELTPEGYQFMIDNIDREVPDLGNPKSERSVSQILNEISNKRSEIDQLLLELKSLV